MFINKLNQLYKPNRILYYVEASEDELKAFYRGIIPEELSKYANTFGTYDYPGVFYLRSLEKEVIGIEFRINDPRIEYPENLKSIVLEPSFFYSIEIDEEVTISKCFIQVLFGKMLYGGELHFADDVGRGPPVGFVHRYDDAFRIIVNILRKAVQVWGSD